MTAPTSILRAPFGWPTLELQPGVPSPLPARAAPPPAGCEGWLRFTTSIDDREEKRVSVRLLASGRDLGDIDILHAHSLEPFQLRLSAADFAAAAREGVALTLTRGTTPLWILASDLPPGAAPLEPGIVTDIAGAPLPRFFDLLGSLASAQTFGWMEGCVLDGLHDLHVSTRDARWRRALDEHLALFITPDHQLIYEDPRGRPSDNVIYGIEGTLSFAVLAKIAPDHPLLALVLDFFRRTLNADGTFRIQECNTAEGSYTIAYPLAVLAQARADRALASLSANVLRIRRESLRRPEGLWLRHHADDTRSFRSWARGVAWYLLGLGRSLEHLAGLTPIDDLADEFRQAAAWAREWQRPDGLWSCFLDDPATLADTSGSAGIAAALARGANAGLLDTSHRDAAQRCWKGLLPHLTSDGFLGGAAQSNRGGEALQRGPYRVLSPMGMGLMGQLAATLRIDV